MRQTDSTPDLPQIDLNVTIITNTQRRRHALLIPGYMQVRDKIVEINGLIDTGADAVVVSQKLVDEYQLPVVRLPKPLTFRNADGSVNKSGTITHRVEGTFNIKGNKLPTNWYVADIGKDDIILGMPWIRKYNPKIDWESGQVRFDPSLIKRQQQIHRYRQKHDPPDGELWGFPFQPQNNDLIMSFIHTEEDDDNGEDGDRLIHDPS